MIRQLMNLFQASETVIKPIKAVTEYPAKILVIDPSLFANPYPELRREICSRNFSEEIDSGLIKIDFAIDFSEASRKIQLAPPDLILCEFVIYPSEYDPNLKPYIKGESVQHCYGFKIFEILEEMDFDYTIPVIFWTTFGLYPKYINKAMELGAFDCILIPSEKINRVVRRALRI